MSECVVAIKWSCLKRIRIRKNRLVGGDAPQGEVFEVQCPALPLCLLPVDQDVRLSASAPAPFLFLPDMITIDNHIPLKLLAIFQLSVFFVKSCLGLGVSSRH